MMMMLGCPGSALQPIAITSDVVTITTARRMIYSGTAQVHVGLGVWSQHIVWPALQPQTPP